MNFERYGGRRFLLCTGCALVNTALLIGGALSEDGYVTLTVATVGAYIAGNAVQRFIERGHGRDRQHQQGASHE